jgi:hypothetical protein
MPAFQKIGDLPDDRAPGTSLGSPHTSSMPLTRREVTHMQPRGNHENTRRTALGTAALARAALTMVTTSAPDQSAPITISSMVRPNGGGTYA